MSGPVDITLSFPIKVFGATTDKIRMRRPKVRDILAGDLAGKSDAAKEIAIFANLCELKPEDLSEMDLTDYRKLQEAYSNFVD